MDFPIKNGDFLIKNGDFPIKNGDCPIKNGDFPIKKGDFPWLCKRLPEGTCNELPQKHTRSTSIHLGLFEYGPPLEKGQSQIIPCCLYTNTYT